MGYIDVTGTYGGIKFLPNGDTEVSFIVAKGSKSTLLHGVDELTAVGKYEPLAMAENAVERFSEIWASKGTGWLVKVVDSKLNGCKKVFAYYGSSVYDSREMSRLIESVIEDCRALEIETMPPAELEALLREWEQKGG